MTVDVGAGVSVGGIGVFVGAVVALGISVSEGDGGLLVGMTGAAQAVIAATNDRTKPMIRDRKLLHMFPSSETYQASTHIL